MKISILGGILIIMSGLLTAGEYADAFLERGVSARALAMANTLGALDRSGTAFISNPAGMAYLKRPQLGLMYTSFFGLADHNYVGWGLPLTKSTSAAVSWIRFGVDDIPIRPDILRQVSDPVERRDSVITLAGAPFSTFSNIENALFISFAKFLSTVVSLGWKYSKFTLDFPVGINFKIIHKNLYNLTAYGVGVDLGGRIRFNGNEFLDISKLGWINLGYALRDVTGTIMYWNTKRQDEIRINPVLSLGLEQPLYLWNMQLNLGITKEFRYDDGERYGAELVFHERLFLRTGLSNSGFCLGFGLNYKAMKRIVHIDYAFLSHELGALHRIGGQIVF